MYVGSVEGEVIRFLTFAPGEALQMRRRLLIGAALDHVTSDEARRPIGRRRPGRRRRRRRRSQSAAEDRRRIG